MVTLNKKLILGVLTLCSMSLFAAGAEKDWSDKQHNDQNKAQTWSDKMRMDSEKTSVKIDIEPADETNMVNLGQKVALEAALLGSADFKIDDVDRTTVMLEGTENNGIFRVEDVNNDGNNDLIVSFDVDALSLDESTKELTLEGKTLDGKAFKGTDSVNVAATQMPATQTPAIEQ